MWNNRKTFKLFYNSISSWHNSNNWDISWISQIIEQLFELFCLCHDYVNSSIGCWSLLTLEQIMSQLCHNYINYLTIIRQITTGHFVSHYVSLGYSVIIAIIVRHNQNNKGPPSEKETLFHVMSQLCHIMSQLCLL
jgi:hypothetical protein